jgi:hypothetical protein
MAKFQPLSQPLSLQEQSRQRLRRNLHRLSRSMGSLWLCQVVPQCLAVRMRVG